MCKIYSLCKIHDSNGFHRQTHTFHMFKLQAHQFWSFLHQNYVLQCEQKYLSIYILSRPIAPYVKTEHLNTLRQFVVLGAVDSAPGYRRFRCFYKYPKTTGNGPRPGLLALRARKCSEVSARLFSTYILEASKYSEELESTLVRRMRSNMLERDKR